MGARLIMKQWQIQHKCYSSPPIRIAIGAQKSADVIRLSFPFNFLLIIYE